jgi:putative Mn2+ efflux pump MntP
VSDLDITIILIAIALAMDSFSASITRGFAIDKPFPLIEALKTGFFFGLFQALMPLIGWFVGVSVR